MNLRTWADMLSGISAPAEIVDLHLKDTLAAFLTGLRTAEGRELARAFDGRMDVAAAVAAIARLSECDDIHLAACVTPGAVVIPVALAFNKPGGTDFNSAVAAGYAAGLGLGMAIGGTRALQSGIWPTLFAGPVMAAVTASRMRGHNTEQLAHAVALSLADSNGRIGRPPGAARWLALADAVAKGIRAAEAAGEGARGDSTLLSSQWLAAQAGHDGVMMRAFETAPPISGVGFKPFPIARQGANAVAAFQHLLAQGLEPNRIDAVEVFVPAINTALLNRPVADDDRLSRLCNMGFQLACAALAPERLYDAERASTPALGEFASRVTVMPASDLEAHLPARWPARVVVKADGERFDETVLAAPFDPDAPDLPQILQEKWRRLLSAEDAAALSGPRDLWQSAQTRVTMAARQGR